MKKLLTLAAFIYAFSFSAEAQLKFGAGVSLFEGNLGLSARAHNTFNDEFAGQATFNYYLTNGSFWDINANVLYSGLDIGDVESFTITPFAGLNIFNASGFRGNTTSLNIGVNGTMPLTDTLDLYIEPKIVIGRGTGFSLAGGVYF